MTITHVTGTISAEGRFTCGWWGSAPPGATLAGEPDAQWAAVALDGDERILAVSPASLHPVPVCPGEPATGLTALLPLPDGTAAIAIRHGDAEVFRRDVPAPAVVSLDVSAHLGRPLARQSIEIPVRIDGTQPPPGAHIVARWEVPGHAPIPLPLIDVGGGEAPVVRVNLDELAGADQCRLSVHFSDGVRTISVASPALSVQRRPASPVIIDPAPDAVVYDDGLLILHGRLDGDGDPVALHWLLDNEAVGQGPRCFVAHPAPGRHTVTLQHNTDRVQVAVVVQPAPTREVESPRWEPPWRTGPIRSVGSSSASDNST